MKDKNIAITIVLSIFTLSLGFLYGLSSAPTKVEYVYQEKEVIKEIPVTSEIICKNTTIEYVDKYVCRFPDEFRLRVNAIDFCKSIGYDEGDIHSWFEDIYVDDRGNTHIKLDIECWKRLEEHTEKRYYYTMRLDMEWWYHFEEMECELF